MSCITSNVGIFVFKHSHPSGEKNRSIFSFCNAFLMPISKNRYHKKGCLAGGLTTTGFILSANKNFLSGVLSKKKTNSSLGCLRTILCRISYENHAMPSIFPSTKRRVFTPIRIVYLLTIILSSVSSYFNTMASFSLTVPLIISSDMTSSTYC